MTNLDVAKMNPGEFMAAYEKVKTVSTEKKPINSSAVSLEEQLNRFEASSFSDEDDRVLHEDLLSL